MPTAVAQLNLAFDEPHNVVVLTLPDQQPGLHLDLLRLNLESNSLRPDGQSRRLQAGNSQGWVLTSFMFPLKSATGSKGLREDELADLRNGAAKDGIVISQLKTYENGPITMAEYFVEEFRGRKIHQKNVWGYMASDGTGLDVHISKIMYTPADQKFMDALVSGMMLIPEYQQDSKTLFGYGSLYFLQKDWSRAAQEYEKALTEEKAKRQLPANEWTVLVDNLGMAYALSGNLDKARSTFEYGVTQDPTYPMFHYNLACASAESADLNGAVDQLRLAFRYKANSLPGEGIPDPAKDDSFQRYLADAKFLQLVKQQCPTSRQTEGGWTCE